MIAQHYKDMLGAKSVIRQISEWSTARGAEIGYENVFDYSLGNPSVPAPQKFTDVCLDLLEYVDPVTLHGYTPTLTLPDVRAKVAESLNRRFGMDYTGDHIFMTTGAAGALAHAVRCIAVPGQNIVTFAPFFPEYKPYVEGAGLTLRVAPPRCEDFQINFAALDGLMDENTAAVLINSPNNPSGTAYSAETLTQLANYLKKKSAEYSHHIFLISDEPYREIVYGAEVPWVPSIYEHTIVCYSYSKSLSLPGERVGWILVPNTNPQAARLMPAVAGAARTLGFVCAPALFQRVIIDCIDEPSDVEAYARNRRALTDALAEYGYTFVEPDGAFYLWVKALEPDANAFCERAKKYELLAVPSDSFGMPGWFRLGYCVSYETIVNSLPAWKQLADEYRSK